MLPGQTTTMTTTGTTERRAGITRTKHVIWLAILFVILLLPLGTHEVRRGSRDLCKGSDGDDAADCGQSPEAAVAAASGRKVAPRRAKFKFHKIQRLDDDDDDEDNDNDNDDGGDDDDDNDNGNEDGDDENDNDNGSDGDVDKADEDENDESSEKANANEDGDEDDDEDDDDDDDNGDDDDDEANANDDDDDDNDGEDNDDDDDDDEPKDADAAEESPSLLNRVMSMFTSDTEEERAAEKAKESPFQVSNIINWLQSLTEQAGDAAPKGKKGKQKAPKQLVKPDIDWLTYLKRWPFNSIFPEPPPAPAKRGSAKPKGSSGGSKAQTTSKRSRPSRPSQSEEYLELLIHSLPAFFGNVSEAKSGECHQQLELLHRQLRAHKLWTFQSKQQPLFPHSLFLSHIPSLCSARCNRQDRSWTAARQHKSVW